MKYKDLLFDADNTLFDFDKANRFAFETMCATMALPFSPELFACYERHNKAMWDRFERGEVTKDQVVVQRFANYLAEIGERRDPVACGQAQLAGLAQCAFMIEHAVEVVQTLAKTHRIFLITNAVAAVQESRLARSPIAPYIEASFISETAGASKPQREYFDYVFAHVDGLERKDCLVIGDSLTSDIKGANDYGLPCCWFNPRRKEDRQGLYIDYVIADLRELYDIVG